MLRNKSKADDMLVVDKTEETSDVVSSSEARKNIEKMIKKRAPYIIISQSYSVSSDMRLRRDSDAMAERRKEMRELITSSGKYIEVIHIYDEVDGNPKLREQVDELGAKGIKVSRLFKRIAD